MLLLVISVITLCFFFWFICDKLCGKGENITDKGYKEEWFGLNSQRDNESSESDTAIQPFKIHVPNEVLSDLSMRLENARIESSLEEKNFEYGFHSEYLHEVVTYWKTKYNWRDQEKFLNQYSHFKTQIEGVDVHFIHVKPTIPEGKMLKVMPILLIHGWPGSFLEFYKTIPLLTTPKDTEDFVFEVVCPSIPGYGFSGSPHQKGFNQRAAARLFVTLMGRLGYSNFYVQGGDWGSLIASLIAKFYPTKVKGVHLNMLALQPDICSGVKYLLVSLFPSLVTPEEYSISFPIIKKLKHLILEEFGYLHIQATKPDTVGSGLSDSPVGLAAYILEKFSTWTDAKYKLLPDGGLTKKFTIDELLTNVMIYWVNNNIKASQRFYKEAFLDKNKFLYDKIPITVPCGVALFPNEMMVTPKMMLSKKFVKNLVSYSVMPRGGHFAAMEEPQLMADDIWKFVRLSEKKSN